MVASPSMSPQQPGCATVQDGRRLVLSTDSSHIVRANDWYRTVVPTDESGTRHRSARQAAVRPVAR